MTEATCARGTVAILSALAQEQDGLVALLQQAERVERASRVFWRGILCGQRVVLALSRVGKVAAAGTAVALIEHFGANAIVFTGVAGGMAEGVRVGDVVVGDGFMQHDMNASPLFARYQIPLTGHTVYTADASLSGALHRACLHTVGLQTYDDHAVGVHQGLIASGDRFVSGAGELAQLRAVLHAHGHRPLALEMEGAAVAQICADYQVPFAAVRTISDRADDTAHVDFPHFMRETASAYARQIVLRFLHDERVQIRPSSRNSFLTKA